jgi:hypothetical protein
MERHFSLMVPIHSQKGGVSMFKCKKAMGKKWFVVLAAVSLCLAWMIPSSRAEAPDKSMAKQTVDLLRAPVEKVFGKVKVKSHEKSEIYGTVVSINFHPEEMKLDPTWGEKMVGVLKIVGAENPEISSESDWGPTEVRADSLNVGEKEAASVQCVLSSELDHLAVTMMFPGGMLKR